MSKRKHTISSDSEEEPQKASKFVDVEASEDEEDEESYSDFINEIAEEAESEERSEAAERSVPAASVHLPAEKAEDFEEYSKKLEERYATVEEQLEVDEVPQQMLLPTDRVPKLWLVRCAPKKERQIVLAVTRRCMSAEKSGESLQVYSVLCNEGVRGYIYVEAYQKQQVLQAIEGVQGAFKTNITQVPIKEMTDLLHVSEIDPVLFQEGNFLRVMKGKYVGDVVQIEGPSESRGMVVVRIVPRSAPGGPQELFSPDHYHPSEVYKVSKETYVYKRDTYKKGYLIKDMPTGYLSPVPPAVPDEKRWFVSAEAPRMAHVSSGEFVEVVSGGLKGAFGTVVSTSSESAQVKIGDRSISVSLTDLRKRYAVGEEVQVVSGRKRGKSGFIVEITNDTLKIGINGFTEEIEVKADEVRLGSTATGTDTAPRHLGAIRSRKDPMVNKAGAILSGEHKGKRGVIKDAHGDMLRVQLITDLKYVQVHRDDFSVQKPAFHHRDQSPQRDMHAESRAVRTPPAYPFPQEGPSTPTTPVYARTPSTPETSHAKPEFFF